MSLTDTACRSASCPVDKARVRLTDSGGLYLEVTPNRSKRWFWKYYFDVLRDRLVSLEISLIDFPSRILMPRILPIKAMVITSAPLPQK